MKKLAFLFFVLSTLSTTAQTLFTYGKDSVSLNDFLQAYHKNNPKNSNEKALREYLDLYIGSRLKVKEAISRGYDTLPQLVADLDNLKAQIMPAYLNDKEDMDRLVEEAFTRSQKDLHLAHIFIPFLHNGVYDEQLAEKKAREAMAALSKTPFEKVAAQYSADPAASVNGGDLGWVTVFTLPYELENLAYAAKPGQVAALHRSRSGFHIFRNLGERKAMGRLQASQILLAFPPAADEAEKTRIKKRADSLYNRLLKGDDFGKLAAEFSNDVMSAPANGEMPEFGVGEYASAFENFVFSLSRNGEVSRPFLSEHGYHIIKRTKHIPVSAVKNAATIQSLTGKIQNNDRMTWLKNGLAKKVMEKGAFRSLPYQASELWAFSDSIMDRKSPGRSLAIQKTTPLFQLGDRQFTTMDWISYAQMNRFRADGTGSRPYAEVFDEFVQSTALNYYQTHLEEFSESFRRQVNEFRDGNLFFEIMQKEIWEPAQSDSTALHVYFQQNEKKYAWKESADAIVFFASDSSVVKPVMAEIRRSPADWRLIVSGYNEKLAADSSRFEFSQLPGAGKKNSFKPGQLTGPVFNAEDHSGSFAYIVRIYNQPAPRTFSEARGLVINDYQSHLEKQWVEALKKKYPVVVNEKLLQDLIRSKKY